MTIWVLALVLLASVAALGYRQGAIRVAFSFVGILLGALLAVPLGRPLQRLLPILGVKDPLLVWALAPVIVFVIFSILFKVIAAPVHKKVDVFYKYHAGDLRLALWERLNQRLGLCLGLINGTAYLVLLAFLVYVASYFTVQFATSDEDPKWMRMVNHLGRGLQSTGFAKIARSIDSIPQIDYEMGNLLALLYQNPMAQARLSRYPAFLSLSERQEFQDMASDKDFTESWLKLQPVMTLAENPRIMAIRNNPELLKLIWGTTAPVLPDLLAYLETGRSTKYGGEKILGRWSFEPNMTINLFRRTKPIIPSTEMQRFRKRVADLGTPILVAMPDSQALFKNLPAGSSTSPQSLQGQWKNLDGKYQFAFSGRDEQGTVENDRLVLKHDGLDMVFSHED